MSNRILLLLTALATGFAASAQPQQTEEARQPEAAAETEPQASSGVETEAETTQVGEMEGEADPLTQVDAEQPPGEEIPSGREEPINLVLDEQLGVYRVEGEGDTFYLDGEYFRIHNRWLVHSPNPRAGVWRVVSGDSIPDPLADLNAMTLDDS